MDVLRASLQQWMGENYSRCDVKFADVEIDGDGRVEEEKPRETTKGSKKYEKS